MKILQVIQQKQLRGAEIFACQLSEELKKLGHEVDVVYLFDNPSSLLSYDVRFIPLHADAKKRLVNFTAFKLLAMIIKEGKYDVVQANAGDTLKYTVISRFLFGWKSKIIFRNASLMSAFMRNTLHRALNRWFLRQCNFIISVSDNCRDDLIQFYPWIRKNSCTIPIGTYDFSDIKAIADAGKEPVFINISSFVPEKNHRFLLKLFHRYFEKHKKGQLWLVGSGRLLKSLEKQAHKLAVQDRVKFWGYRRDPIAILKSADVFIMPSHIEGLPGAILEAMSCRIPVIAAAVGGIPEVIRHGVNGFCIPNDSFDEYLKCMETMIDDDASRKKFIDTAHQIVKDYFLMPHIAKVFLREYERISKV